MSDRRVVEANDRRTVTGIVEPARNRISWASVLAGVAIAFTVMVVLNMIAMGIGLGTINITEDPTPVGSIAASFGITMVIINLIALAAGGYVAGRYAGHLWHGSGIMQGVLTWAVALALSMWLMGTAAGTLIGGVGNVVGGGLGLIGQGVSAVAPGLAEGVDQAAADLDLSQDNIRGQLGDLLRATATEDAEPAPAANAEGPASPVAQESADTANPVLMDVRINRIVQAVFAEGEDPFSEANRQNLVSLLSDETDLSEAEADEIVSSWEQDWENLQLQLQQAEDDLREAAEDAQGTLTSLMLMGALALIVFAVVTGWMGRVGAGHRRRLSGRTAGP